MKAEAKLRLSKVKGQICKFKSRSKEPKLVL